MRSRPRCAAMAILAMTAGLGVTSTASAGHEFPFYPSYYPQEITVSVLAPAAALPRLVDGTVHAYVGADPFGAAAPPTQVTRTTSLGAYVVVTLNPAAALGDPARRCLAARAVADGLDTAAGFRPYAYPVTAYHPDYLQHADLSARALAGPPAAWSDPLRLRPRDAGAAALVPAARRADGPDWDAAVETVDVSALWTGVAAAGPHGGVGPHWLKAGWHHAYLLLRDGVTDAAVRQRVDAEHGRLAGGEAMPATARLTRERALVSSLRAGCERTVAGYTERREPINVDYSIGVENVAHDAQAGLNSAIFVRTIKLKDFPWNGWLTLGVPARPVAAWNPVAGFGDPAGRLVWAALADPALFPSPHGSGWVPNRVVVAEAEPGAPDLSVPDDALAPEAGTGAFRRVGPGRRAGARVVYRVLGSRFHDGTALEPADLLYALGLPWRTRDGAVLRATAGLREGLVALRVLRVETDVLAFGEDKLTYDVPIVEVFVNRAGSTAAEAALVASPWTAVPWPLLALAEDAEARGVAALSAEAAQARGLPWLDLARDRAVVQRLRARLDDLVGSGEVPPALAGVVTPERARARWTALRAFHDDAGHLLVTNGPYRLASWTDDTTVLQVFRDLSYPRGVGVFNSHATPLRAWVTATEVQADTLVLRGDLERVDRFGREFRIVREPLVTREVRQDKRSLPVAHYVAIGPDGAVAATGTAEAEDPGQYRIDLRVLDRPGAYAILVALTVDDNRTELPVKVVPWTR